MSSIIVITESVSIGHFIISNTLVFQIFYYNNKKNYLKLHYCLHYNWKVTQKITLLPRIDKIICFFKKENRLLRQEEQDIRW